MLFFKPLHFLIPFVFLIFICGSVSAQEICTNGIDDDNDGLIDLNDSLDCACHTTLSITSLIPNPSFEQYDCVPFSFSELSCAETWEQATIATSDFFLNVPDGFWPSLIPMPVPDGQGIGGFIISNDPFLGGMYNEYIGGCLVAPMIAATEYTLQMNLAGTSWGGSDSPGVLFGPVDITIFGSASCPNWPVLLAPSGLGMGCPTSQPEWIELGHSSYTADGTWQSLTIQFTPNTDIQAIMIGGPCELTSDFTVDGGSHYPYFWIDNLLLNETNLFSIIDTTGTYCAEDLMLVGTTDTLAQYVQWYYEGVALPSQTNNELAWSDLNLSAGNFQFIGFPNDSTCTGAEIVITLPEPILPVIDASPQSGCEPLTVQFNNLTPTPSVACVWDFGDGNTSEECDPIHVFTESGLYSIDLSLTFESGCTYDTLYQQYIHVNSIPQAVISANPQPTTVDNTEITFYPESNNALVQWLWNFGNVAPYTANIESPTVLYPSLPGSYPVDLIITNSSGCVDTISSFILIEYSHIITLPNIFTPNGDGENDRFVPFQTVAEKGILTIYNRWGQEIFQTDQLMLGWDGGDAVAGTYYWTLQPLGALTPETNCGYVTLVREE